MLQKFHLFLVLLLCSSAFPGMSRAPEGTPEQIKVYIFLHESCLISQNYTLTLKALHEEFADDHLQFIGLFPNLSSTPENIQAFKETYGIPFPLRPDHCHTLTEALGATITPEVVVYQESTAEILYKGRIDDTYFRIGKRRVVTTTSELKDVLQALTQGLSVEVADVPAIGCFIGQEKLSTPNCH